MAEVDTNTHIQTVFSGRNDTLITGGSRERPSVRIGRKLALDGLAGTELRGQGQGIPAANETGLQGSFPREDGKQAWISIIEDEYTRQRSSLGEN